MNEEKQVEPWRSQWSHEPHGSFIRGEPWVSLLFESTGQWTLRIYKKKSALGIPIPLERGFTKRYAEGPKRGVARPNTFPSVKPRDKEPKKLPERLWSVVYPPIAAFPTPGTLIST